MKVMRSIFRAFRLLNKIINPILKALFKSRFQLHRNKKPSIK
ncbi:hypothetical protein bcgnr5372_30620 [Bacillus luti]